MSKNKMVGLKSLVKRTGVSWPTLDRWAKALKLKFFEIPCKGRGRPTKQISDADAAKLLAKAKAFTKARDGQ